MDIDDVMLQFDQIEKKVGNLIQHCQTLESENARLTARVQDLEADLQKRVDKENTFSEQKERIRLKIDGLLARLDHIAADEQAPASTGKKDR